MPRKHLLSLHEAIVVALINQPSRTASFEEIAKCIEVRNLYPERKGKIPLTKQVMLCTTKAKEVYAYLFEEIGSGFIRLQDTYANFPILLDNALEAIMEHNKALFHPRPKKIRFFDVTMDNFRHVEIYPKNVVCIITEKKSGDKKFLYLRETDLNGKEIITVYNIYGTFEELKKNIDPLSHYLATINDSAIVNVGHYKIGSDKKVITNLAFKLIKDIPAIKFSTSPVAKLYKERFELMQQFYKERISLEISILKHLQK